MVPIWTNSGEHEINLESFHQENLFEMGNIFGLSQTTGIPD